MAFIHSARRGLAMTTSGLVVIGAGAAAGLIVVDLQTSWAATADTAVRVDTTSSDPAPVDPARVTVIEKRHVTPKPEVVPKKVASVPQPARPTRTVVAPAPRPPAPSSKPAAATTTSKRS